MMHNAVMRRFDYACSTRSKHSRGERSRRADQTQPHRATQFRDDRCRILVPSGNDPTAPIGQDEIMLKSLRKWIVQGSPSSINRNKPVPVLLLLLLEHSLICKQAKWLLDLPLMPPVIVSPDDMLSQEKPKLIPASGVEDDDSRP